MKITVFDAHRFERVTFEKANSRFGHELKFIEARLSPQTAPLAAGADAVCSFVNDRLDAAALDLLKAQGVKLVALRSAGFNHVNLERAAELGLPVVRVPEYSPYAVAELAVTLMLTLNRKTHKAYLRVREGNFALDGLVGFDMHGKTAGIIGTGRIGRIAAGILRGFGCRVILFDANPDQKFAAESGCSYVALEQLYRESDIISLHVPLKPQTRHLINSKAIATMKPGVMLINTGRGALIDTRALVEALKTGHVGSAGLDVYEEEEGVFFCDLSEQVLQDDVLARLLTFPNVLITSHQGFLTHEALDNIANTTLQNVADFAAGKTLANAVHAESHCQK